MPLQPVTPAVFCTPLDAASTTVAAPHAPGSGTIAVASADPFGSPSPSAPVRLTATRKSDGARSHYLLTGVSGNTLTVAPADGYADLALSAGDAVAVTANAGTLGDIHSAILGTQSAVNGIVALANSGALTGPQGSSGSGGTPAGVSGSIQYNNGGAFGGSGSVNADGEFTIGTTASVTPLRVLATARAGRAMTGESSPSPMVASASQEVYGNDAWNAFDSNLGTAWIGNPSNSWLQIDYGAGNAFVAISYGWTHYPSGGWNPNTFAFVGSNDGTTWTQLDSQIGIADGSDYTFALATNTAYRYYRLNVASNNGGTYTGLTEFLVNALVPVFSAGKSSAAFIGSVTSASIATNSLSVASSVDFSNVVISSSPYGGSWINMPPGLSALGEGGAGSTPWLIKTSPGSYINNGVNNSVVLTGPSAVAIAYEGWCALIVNAYAVTIPSYSSTTTPVSIQGATGQTADLQQWQASTGTILAGVDAHGYVRTALTDGAPATSPATGSQAFDPATNKLWIFDGSAWKSATLS